jgi:hypothetical protein
MCSVHNYPEDSRPCSCPATKMFYPGGILEPNNDTIYINILPALVKSVHLTDLDAKNKVKMVFCYFCVLGRHVELALGEANPLRCNYVCKPKHLYYISLHITQSHRRPKASSLSSVSWVQIDDGPQSSSVLAAPTGLSSRACCASCCLSDFHPRQPRRLYSPIDRVSNLNADRVVSVIPMPATTLLHLEALPWRTTPAIPALTED